MQGKPSISLRRASSATRAAVRVPRRVVVEAAGRGARLVVLSEVFAWRVLRYDEIPATASTIPGPVSDFLCDLAADLGIVLVGGSFLEDAGTVPW